jgi:hypothetical protein
VIGYPATRRDALMERRYVEVCVGIQEPFCVRANVRV